MAIAHNAQEIRSPVDSSMSISRESGWGETSAAMAISSSVVLPRAESTATTRLPCSRWATMRLAACLILSASATEVPPNFITMVGPPLTARRVGLAGAGLGADHHVAGTGHVLPARPDALERAHRGLDD